MPRGPDEDLDLLTAAKSGDEAAFRALFDKYRDRVVALAQRYLRSREDALDVAQEAFIKAFRSLDEFRGQSRFAHWLFRIAVNAAIDARRGRAENVASYDEARESGGVTAADPRPDGDPVLAAQDSELRQACEDALEQLSPEHRAAFALHAMQGLKYQEIADVLGVPVGTVMSRLHYARKHLQGLLRRFSTDE